MRTIIELGNEFPLRSPSAITLGASALNHEARNDAVESSAKIEALLGELLKVGNMVRSNVIPELKLNSAVLCFDRCCGVLLGCHVGAKRNGLRVMVSRGHGDMNLWTGLAIARVRSR